MQTADRCLVKNLTTGHNLIVYSHNVYCKNSDGIVQVATEKDITSSNASLFFKSGADEIPITMITYKHTKGDILRTNRESLGRSKRIQIRKRLSLTPIKPLAAMNRRKNLVKPKKDEDKSLKWIVSRIEDEQVMAVLQNHNNNVNCGGEQTKLALKIRKCLNKQNKDTNKNLRSSLDRIEVMKDDTITGDFDVEQTGSVSEDNDAEEEERTDSQVFDILQDKEIEVNQDNNDIEDFEFEPIVSVCEDDNIEEEKRDGQKFRIARKTDKKINEKQTKRVSDEYQRASDSEKSILEQDIDSEGVVTRKYLEEELGALGRVIVERITEELDAKIPSSVIPSNRSESIRTTTNVSEIDQNSVDNQIIIDGISINSHCWYLAANAKTMRKRANHIMRGCWTEEERNILVLRRNKRYDDGRVVKSRELENIKTLCLNLQSARKLKYKKGKHNIEANLRDWLKDFLKNDRYRRSQLVYNDEDL